MGGRTIRQRRRNEGMDDDFDFDDDFSGLGYIDSGYDDDDDDF